MLKINNKEYKVLTSEIKYVNATHNARKGYSILVSLDIELPTELNSKITIIEIFDTANFIDFIDSEVNLEFGNIYNNQIEMKLNINDELIKLEYKGLLNIK